MKDFLKKYWNEQGTKGMLIGGLVLTVIFTWYWYSIDGYMTYTMVYGYLYLLVATLGGKFISKKVKQWRAGRKR